MHADSFRWSWALCSSQIRHTMNAHTHTFKLIQHYTPGFWGTGFWRAATKRRIYIYVFENENESVEEKEREKDYTRLCDVVLANGFGGMFAAKYFVCACTKMVTCLDDEEHHDWVLRYGIPILWRTTHSRCRRNRTGMEGRKKQKKKKKKRFVRCGGIKNWLLPTLPPTWLWWCDDD